MDDITRQYMHDVRIMPSMGKAEIAPNSWISNLPSVVQRFYRVWSTSDILLVEIDQPALRPRPSAFIYKCRFYKRFWLENDEPVMA